MRKQLSWLDEQVSLGHWRTSDGTEVDLIVEDSNGNVLALEVKANERAVASDFKGLTQLRDALEIRFKAGIILTTGTRPYTYEDRLHVVPIASLWEANTQ